MDLYRSLHCFQELQCVLDIGHGKLHACSELCERILPSTHQSGTSSLRQQLQTLQTDYEVLRSRLNDLKAKAENDQVAWSQWQRTYKQLNDWLKDTNIRLRSHDYVHADLAEKKAHMDKIKVRKC